MKTFITVVTLLCVVGCEANNIAQQVLAGAGIASVTDVVRAIVCN